MDFRSIREITVPQGDVLKIADAGGNVVWRKRLFPTISVIPSSCGTAEITPLSGDTIRYGCNAVLHAVPSDGYVFQKFAFDGNENTENDAEVGPILSDICISVFFAENELTSYRK